MKTFTVTRRIPATLEHVWGLLTDASKLASGGLGITRIDGRIAPGERLSLWTEATASRAFKLRVVTFDAPTRMTWEGGLPFGLFRGVRTFTLTPATDGVVFEMSETFSGPMSPLIERSIPDLSPSFEKFASGLAALAQVST